MTAADPEEQDEEALYDIRPVRNGSRRRHLKTCGVSLSLKIPSFDADYRLLDSAELGCQAWPFLL